MVEPGGLYFEEFEVGQEFISPARTVTEGEVMQFAQLSGDSNPLHTDAEFAKATMFGERIAHGLLGLSIASGLASRSGFLEGTTIAFMGLEWKFKAPILFGDTIHVVTKVVKTRALKRLGGGVVTLAMQVINQDEVVTQLGEWSVLMKFRPED